MILVLIFPQLNLVYRIHRAKVGQYLLVIIIFKLYMDYILILQFGVGLLALHTLVYLTRNLLAMGSPFIILKTVSLTASLLRV